MMTLAVTQVPSLGHLRSHLRNSERCTWPLKKFHPKDLGSCWSGGGASLVFKCPPVLLLSNQHAEPPGQMVDPFVADTRPCLTAAGLGRQSGNISGTFPRNAPQNGLGGDHTVSTIRDLVRLGTRGLPLWVPPTQRAVC